MTERSLERESLTCAICLDLLSRPVTIPCGHSFCLNCIQHSWREEEARYKCPQCRKRFSTKPALNKNIMLADLVEQVKKTTPTPDRYAGPQDVSCDVCTGRKLKAVKSCLQCVVSFCKDHLQPHRDVTMLQKHQLVAPSNKLQENICHEHNEVKKMFCRTDQLPVCVGCCLDKHKGHDTVSSADERAQRQAELDAKIDLLKNRVLNKEEVQQQLFDINLNSCHSAKNAELHCTNTLAEIKDTLNNIEVEVHQHISSQLRKGMKHNDNLRSKLRCECSNLTKSISEMEEMTSTQEHNHFLLLYPSASSPPSSSTDAQPTSSQSTAQQPTDTQKEGDSSNILIKPTMDFEYVIKAMTAFKEEFPCALSHFKLPQPDVPLSEPVTAQELLHYRREIILDQNTAQSSLLLVSDRKVTYVNNPINAPYYPGELIYGHVLSQFGMIGRSYWQVLVNKAKYVCVAASYKDFGNGDGTDQCAFGHDDKSWALMCDNIQKRYSFCFNSVQLDIVAPVGPAIGVYLDHSAGVVSFYSVDPNDCNKVALLLHKVQTSFTQPVYAGLALRHLHDFALLAKLKDEC